MSTPLTVPTSEGARFFSAFPAQHRLNRKAMSRGSRAFVYFHCDVLAESKVQFSLNRGIETAKIVKVLMVLASSLM